MNRDFYTGFEGEPEIAIEHQPPGGSSSSIRTWVGFFDELMEKLEPGPEGWTGIAAHHHLHTGWNSEESWQDPDVADTRRQIGIPGESSLKGQARDLRSAFIELLDDALRAGGRVILRGQ